ncbi:hypothetical protein PoHVEF18_004278 [Penicillium ochrochloron]
MTCPKWTMIYKGSQQRTGYTEPGRRVNMSGNFLSDTSTAENPYYGPSLVGAFVLTYLGMAISTAAYWRQTFRFNTTIRAGLISLIYRQTNKMNAAEFKSESSITLMGTDVERIVRHFWSIHEAWAGPVDVAIGVFLLARQLGITSLIPAVISLSMVPCQTLSHHTLIKY